METNAEIAGSLRRYALLLAQLKKDIERAMTLAEAVAYTLDSIVAAAEKNTTVSPKDVELAKQAIRDVYPEGTPWE